MRRLLSIFLVFATLSSLSTAQVVVGTQVRLLLRRTLSTQAHGGLFRLIGVKPMTREGSTVLFEVVDPIRDRRGRIVVDAGAPAVGTVIDSQVAGGFRPHAPRLAVSVESVMDRNGDLIPIRFSTRHEGKWAHVFTREETAEFMKEITRDRARNAFSDRSNRDAADQLRKIVVGGQYQDLRNHPDKVLNLRNLATACGMPHLVKFIDAGRIDDVMRTVASIQSGQMKVSLSSLSAIGDAFSVLSDTWHAGFELFGWIDGRLKAPQIVAPSGFPLEAVVTE